MDFALGWIGGLLTFTLAFGIALHVLKLTEKEEIEKPVVADTISPTSEMPEVAHLDLGAVKRPDIEEIEKKENPKIKAEEEAWTESITTEWK